jgi:hypothetical protein
MADTRKFLQVQATTTAGAGISATATTIVLSSLVHLPAVGGGTVAMTDIGTLGWATLEPATSREEIISFTGITQNGDGTATITGVTRNLKSYAPYDQYSATGYAHAGGATFIITNNPQMYDAMANKANDETITGLWDFSTSIPTLPASNPTTGNQATRKTYVDGLDALAMHLAGTETVTGVKTFTSTAKAKYNTHPTFTANEEIIDKKYADDLAIAGAPNASETVKGIVEEATDAEVAAGTAAGATGARLFVNPAKLTSAGVSATTGASDASKIIRTDASGLLHGSFTNVLGDGSDGNVTISSPTTLTSDMYYNDLTVTSTLTTAGYRVFVKGTISGAGTIDWGTPSVGGNASAATAGTGGAQSGGGILKNTAGQTGGAGSTNNLQSNGNDGVGGTNGQIGLVGVAGGNGGIVDGDASSGGSGGAILFSTKVGIEKIGTISLIDTGTGSLAIRKVCGSGSGGSGQTGSGSYGSGYNTGGGGGSGASGGIIMIACNTFAGTFTIKSNGATGGTGGTGNNGSSGPISGGGGGAGGNGGCSVVVYNTKTWTGSYNLTGGTGGTGGTGSDGGGTGSTGATGTTGTSYEVSLTGLI